jgi:F-box interacting protein
MRSKKMFGENDPCYVFALGCNQLRPRCIGCPPELAGFFDAPVLVRGNLHWSWWPYPVKKNQSGKMITVFDTTAESFHLMRTPITEARRAYLYEVDDTLGIYSCNDTMTAVHIWVMQDYGSEVWSHKYHVKLPVAEIREHEGRDVVVVHEDRDVFVLYSFGPTLFLIDTEGKLLASSQFDACISLVATHRFKQSLVQHNLFSALQGALNAWSFI